jgi:hypothetical protein
VGLVETIEALRTFGGTDVPIHPLPRLAGNLDACWRAAPPLARICEAEHD